MKTCFKCKETKPLNLFHKHKKMKSGYLNKCAACVVKDVAEWRTKNPNARKIEHAKNREKQGFKTREEYLTEKKKNAKGRRICLLEHMHKRRIQKERYELTELDSFVFEEAVKLKDLRKEKLGSDWHIDHIVPLNHRDACGFHNAFNLQVVPAVWNLKKSNKNMDTFFAIAGY